LERVVSNLNLNFTYYAIGNIKNLNAYKDCPFVVEALSIVDSSSSFALNLTFPDSQGFLVNGGENKILFGQAFKNQFGVFRLVKNPYKALHDQYTVEWNPTRVVASNLLSSLLVVPKGTVGIINISMEATHPELAADVVNQLMIEYELSTREDKRETMRQTILFIDERLKAVSREMDSVTRQLLQYQSANNIINTETQSQSYFSRADEYEKGMSEQMVQINVARMIDDYLRDSKNDFTLVPSSLGLNDITLNTMISAYNAVQLERESMINSNTPATNPRVQQKDEQLERLRKNIRENLRNLVSSYQAAVNRLSRNNNAVRSQIKMLPVKEQNFLEIKRQQEIKQEVVNLLMQKREESAIASAATISNIKILEEATPITIPVSPNRRNVQLIAIAIGILIPAGFIFLLEVLNDKVTTRYDIEKITAAPILGEVGHSFGGEALVVKTNNRGIVAEQFRIIRSNLQYILARHEKPVILITSSFSGEGKSFVSTNMGAVMSLASKKTIVLEFDIRKPKVLSGLGLPKKPGLTNYMLGKLSLEELPIPVAGYDNYFVLACGPIPPNPAEMLLDPKLNELFSYLKKNFDVIIIDTAPVGMVSDAMTLSQFADATLYIVRQGHTYKKQIGLIDDYYQANKLPKISIVINDVKVRSGYGYYGYGRYGYGYGYGSGYFEDETPPPTLLRKWFGWLDLKKMGKQKKRKRVVA
jgi:capsular exopolysaccharide synthesis family protein